MKMLCYYWLRASTLGPNQSPIQRGSFPWRQSDYSSTLTIYLHLVPKINKKTQWCTFTKRPRLLTNSLPLNKYEYGVNADTGTGTATDEKVFLFFSSYYYYYYYYHHLQRRRRRHHHHHYHHNYYVLLSHNINKQLQYIIIIIIIIITIICCNYTAYLRINSRRK